jgi:hypothetical protein
VIYRRSHRFIQFFALFVAVAAASASFAGGKKKKAAVPLPSPPPPLIEVTGSILGVKILAPLEEAREKLAQFKLVKDAAAEPAEKEEREGGERIIWRLAENGTPVDRCVGEQGRKDREDQRFRSAGEEKPFGEIGDLARAKVHNDSTVLWIVQRPDGIELPSGRERSRRARGHYLYVQPSG